MSKKVVLTVEEKLIYNHEITVIQPEGMSDESFERLIGQVERWSSDFDDLVYKLSKSGVTIVETCENSPESPSDAEVEVVDINDLYE